MKKNLAALLAFAAALQTPALAQQYRIDHLEPASWWTGMQSRQLQLMVHGPRIAELEPALGYPGVRITAVAHVPNPNYLFIDLEIAADAAPGQLDLQFRRGAKVLHYPYALQARAAGSAQRAGFDGSDAIYEVMPDRYANGDARNDSVAGLADKLDRADGSGRHGGDIQGMIDHLDYVAGMGYTVIWPTPMLTSDMPRASYHGYATTDHYRIDPRYGSNEDYRRFVAQARAHGLGVIQDVVLNHIGSHHWWMADLPTPDWINYQGKFVPTMHHRAAVQDPYGSAEDKRNFTGGWFVENMPDLNQGNPYLANYLIQNNIWWIEYAGLAGLRVDTYSYSDGAFLSEWTRRILAEYPRLNLVGEEWSTIIPVVSRWLEGKQNFDGYVSHMPSMMDFPLNDTLRRALAARDGDENSLNNLYETLSQDYLYPHADQMVLFEGNHDMARIFSVLGEDMALYKMAMAYVLTAPRIPQLYYGTEILMTSTVKGRDDASYRRDFPGGWPGDPVNAFTGAGLSAQQLEAQAMLKKLLNWRKTQPVIHHGKTMHYGPEHNTYVYFRYDGTHKVMVALNKNATETVLPTARFHEMLDGVASGVDVLSGATYALNGELKLPPRSALILELKPVAAAGQVVILDRFASPQLHNSRALRIYLPPGYASHPQQRYPVLYMHDGQNLFDAATAAYGVEWGMAKTMDRLIAEASITPAIVVGIDNTGDRLAEYTPCCDPQHGGGKLDAYERFILDTVKPYVDRTLRTEPGPEHTAIMGSSLGGLASVDIAQRHPDVFSMAASLSGSFWWNERALVNHVPPHVPVRFYLDAGTDNDGLPDTIAMRDALLAAGYRSGTELYFTTMEGGIHNEKSWAARVHLPLQWFFGTQAAR